MKPFKIKIRKEPAYSIITWTHSSTCNFNCSYCVDFLHDNKFQGPKDYKKFINFFSSWSKDNPLILDITGGEPTVWPHLENFCNELKSQRQNKTVIQMTTNGGRSLHYWKNFNADIDEIGISFHYEFANFRHTLQVIDILIKKNYKVNLLLVTLPKDFRKTVHYIRFLRKLDLDCNVEAKIVYDNEGNEIEKNYTQEMLDFFFKSRIRKHSPMKTYDLYMYIRGRKVLTTVPEIKSRRANRYQGWKCYGGQKNLSVWHDGSVWGAECATFRKYPLGNIYEDNVKILDKPVKCEQRWCVCGSDISIDKDLVRKNYHKRKS